MDLPFPVLVAIALLGLLVVIHSLILMGVIRISRSSIRQSFRKVAR